MLVLGLSAQKRGSAAALVRDGVPLAAAAEERFTRTADDDAFPARALRSCLEQAGARPRDLDHVVLAEKPLRHFERVLVGRLADFPRRPRAFAASLSRWLGDRLWIRGRIADELDLPWERVLFVEHHTALAAAAFLASPFEEAAVLIVDDACEWAATSLLRGQGGTLQTLDRLTVPHSLGLLASAVAGHLGLPGNGDGLRQLGDLAGYGRPGNTKAIDELLAVAADGAHLVLRRAVALAEDEAVVPGEALASRLGPPRHPGEPLLLAGADARHADLARSFHDALQRAVLALARALAERVPSPHLCLGGLLATDERLVAGLVRDGPFAELFVPAAPDNAGSALGAALHVCAQLAAGGTGDGATRGVLGADACLGEPVRAAGASGGTTLHGEAEVLEALRRHLAAGHVVAWVRGRFEWGARPLGHRCLLADPRAPRMRERIDRLLARESFRSLGCAVTEEAAASLFEIPPAARHAARFGAVRLAALPATVARAPAVVHVDGSALPQVVAPDVDPLFHRLLLRFGEGSGLPLLLQAALAPRGDPPVRGEADALAMFERTDLDALVLEDRLYEKDERGALPPRA